MKSRLRLIRGAGVVDGDRVSATPGAILLDGGRVVAAGEPASMGIPAEAELVERPNAVLIPALVNAHAHLDLTHVGPLRRCGDFVNWIGSVRGLREDSDDRIAASVQRGVEFSRAGGTAVVGDIAGEGSLVPLKVLRACGLPGVSFIEVFGLGLRQQCAIDHMARCTLEGIDEDGGARIGLQPHAPYSCGEDVYRFAAASGRPVATHLAETAEELQFTRHAAGPLADFLRRIGAG